MGRADLHVEQDAERCPRLPYGLLHLGRHLEASKSDESSQQDQRPVGTSETVARANTPLSNGSLSSGRQLEAESEGSTRHSLMSENFEIAESPLSCKFIQAGRL